MPLVASMLTLAMISSILLFWAAVLCGEMPLSVVGGFGWKFPLESGMTCGNPMRGILRWCFMFPWCVVSIGLSRYWQGSIQASGLWYHAIMQSPSQRMPCASNQVRWNCMWMPRCENLVPVVGWSCILILQTLGILLGSAWVSCSTLMKFSIAMISHCWCSFQSIFVGVWP